MSRKVPLWGDMRFASREFMERSFAQERQRIVAKCLQLKQDVDWFNENRCPEEPIALLLDFTADIAEIEAFRAKAVDRWVQEQQP